MIKSFILPSLIFGTLLLLSACTSLQPPVVEVPSKTFQYAYQNPSRILSTPEFSKQLSAGSLGGVVKIRLQNNRLSTVKLGRKYYSASGYECRRYKVQARFQYSACKINGRWYEASPIIISNK